jgi:hypothetical protein
VLSVLRNLLLENLGIKLVALLLALALYLHVYTERTATMLMAFPLEITDLADSLTLTGPQPEPVRAELRGTGKQLIRLRLTEPRLKISLLGVGPGHYQRTLVSEDLPLMRDEGLEVNRILSTRTISLEIEHVQARALPVVVTVTGTPRDGWAWRGAFVAQPARVLVRGPRHEIALLDTIRLHPIRIEGKADTVRASAAADSLPPWCVTDPATVHVAVVLERVAAGR